MKHALGRIFGSIAVKIGLIILALGATTAAALVSSATLTSRVTNEVDTLIHAQLPPLEAAIDVAAAISNLKDAANSTITANSKFALPQQSERLYLSYQNLTAALDATGLDMTQNFGESLTRLDEHIKILIQARETELTAESQNRKRLAELNTLSSQFAGDLQESTKKSAFRLMLSTSDAASTVKSSVTNLLDKDVHELSVAYLLKSEAEFAAGIAIALGEARGKSSDRAIRSLAESSLARLAPLIDEAASFKNLSICVAVTRRLQSKIESLLAAPTTSLSSGHRGILDSHAAVASAFASTITTLQTSLTKTGDSTVKENEIAVKALVEGSLQEIRDIDEINLRVKSILLKALQGTASGNSGYISSLQADLEKEATEASRALSILPADLAQKARQLLDAMDSETGLLATRLNAIRALANARETAEALETELTEISAQSVQLSAKSLSEISASGAALLTGSLTALSTMKWIGLVATLILIGSPVLTYFYIIRPLLAVTRSTERLAGGDLSGIDRTRGTSGEIARLFKALNVFRLNILEKEQMEGEARARAEQERHSAAKAEEERLARIDAEKARERDDERKEQERLRIATQERDALNAANETERAARHAEQTAIVEALAQGLRRLSESDISQTIDIEFPAGYEQLRSDFNTALLSLKDVVQSLSATSQAIHGDSSEISSAADDLSLRTERTASTLGETAAALTELTAAVKSAAGGAEQAKQTVLAARAHAETTSLVVVDAISAMDAISQSSSKISKIIGVIDDIAFQTNLLALNAGVEAARAGDAGRGFAVVASEVRALAQRSSSAAREINHLINASTQDVKRGVSLVNETGDALRSIVGDVSQIANHMAEITTSAAEQSIGISEINAAVASLDQATQQNAAMFEETTAASHSLTAQASVLTGIVSQFKSDNLLDGDCLSKPLEGIFSQAS